MRTIKRYPNRKLYDTAEKQYITLDTIAEQIHSGQNVVVIDNATGEDLTPIILSQILFEQQKKHGVFLPAPLLSSLIRFGWKRPPETQPSLLPNRMLSRLVDKEVLRRIKLLEIQGELTERQAENLRTKLMGMHFHVLGDPATKPPQQQHGSGTQQWNEGLGARERLVSLLVHLDTLEDEIEE